MEHKPGALFQFSFGNLYRGVKWIARHNTDRVIIEISSEELEGLIFEYVGDAKIYVPSLQLYLGGMFPNKFCKAL